MVIVSGSVQINSFVYSDNIQRCYQVGYSKSNAFRKVRSNHHRFQLTIPLVYHPICEILDVLFFFL